MKRVIIIGGGASGLMAALNISKNYEIIILERKSLAKKLLQTGAGKCNFWNEEINLDKYNSTDKKLLANFFSKEKQNAVLNIFNKLGIIPKIKNGYYYPSSESAQTLKNALLNKVQEKALIKENFLITNIEKVNNKFIIKSENETLSCDKLIIATGSNASLKDKDFLSYNFLKKMHHTIIPVLPALVGLKLNDKILKSLAGLRIDAEVSLYEENTLLKKETGQIQLTSYGLSGICIFNLSSIIARGLYNNKKEVLKINFLSFIKTTDYLAYFSKRNELMDEPKAKDLFETILNYKLVNAIFSSEKIKDDIKWNDLPTKKKQSLLKRFTSYEVNIAATNSLEEAQVATGGVSLKEINLETMESLIVKNLYIIGEILDVDGICGGYNLAFAFISGYLAATAIKE